MSSEREGGRSGKHGLVKSLWNKLPDGPPRFIAFLVVLATLAVGPAMWRFGIEALYAWLGFFVIAMGIMTFVVTRQQSLDHEIQVLKPGSGEAGGAVSDTVQHDGVFDNVAPVTKHMEDVIRRESKRSGQVEILNLALDGEFVVPWITYTLVATKEFQDIAYKMLLLLPGRHRTSELLDGDSNIRTSVAEQSLATLNELALDEKARRRGIELQVRTYCRAPQIHGFLINDRHLYIGFTEIRSGKLFGADQPYTYLDLESEHATFGTGIRRHYLDFFRSWFELDWGREAPSTPFPNSPIVVGHRGHAGDCTENTITGIRRAVELGCDWVELDFQRTRDGVPIAFHDKTLARMAGVSQRVADVDHANLPGIHGDEEIPTVHEVAESLEGESTCLMAEIIDFAGWSEIVGPLVERLGAERLIVASFDHDVLRSVRDQHPDIATLALIEGAPVDIEGALRDSRCTHAGLGVESATADVVARVQASGVPVLVWTVNDPATIDLALDWGVSGIISDHPERALERIAGRKTQEAS